MRMERELARAVALDVLRSRGRCAGALSTVPLCSKLMNLNRSSSRVCVSTEIHTVVCE